jgi:hypothetical protein
MDDSGMDPGSPSRIKYERWRDGPRISLYDILPQWLEGGSSFLAFFKKTFS